jgi:hypothetical protein
MKPNEILEMLQLLHAGLMVEAVARFHQHGLLKQVTSDKLREDRLSAEARIAQFEIESAEDLFCLHTQLYGFVHWHLDRQNDSICISGRACKLHDIASATTMVSPCDVCCINPLRTLSAALPTPMSLSVDSTLWDSDECLFTLRPEK